MFRLLEKVIKFLRNLFWTDYDICYEEMESRGIGVFGMCCGLVGGDRHTDYLSYECVSCPHLVLGCKTVDKSEVAGSE